jgi:hypothetical protein
MLVSHEVPKALLEKSFGFNNFDYFLPAFAHHKEYLNHFITARKQGRFIILDNGLFENDLKDEQTLLDYYNLIQPDVFIAPDDWNDSELTWSNYQQWKTKVDPSKIMVVIQANNMFEAEDL